jgi:hypothetical protein
MSIEAMKQALEELENCADLLKMFEAPIDSCVGGTMLRAEKAADSLRTVIEAAENQEPVAWLYPEGLEGLQRGKCWTAYGTKQDADCSIPVYLNAAVAPKVEPAKAECGGFNSHPAAPVYGCACRWDHDDKRVVTCERHQGWLDVIAEWADRAREAEAKLREKNTPEQPDIAKAA